MENIRIIRSRRSSMSIHISPEGEVSVKAPHLVPKFIIERFVKEKEEWIKSTLQKISRRMKKPKKYVEGEEYLFLGIPRALTFYDGTRIHIDKTKLLFPKALLFRMQKELEQWFVSQAKEIITKRVAEYSTRMQASYNDIFFSDTKSKWGTCTHDNRLQFNWRLVMTPLMVLDYVVIHELSHTTEKNHGRNFWSKVRQFTPAYRQHRKWLATNAHLLTL